MQRWTERTGGRWNLKYLSLALESANLANAMAAMFYASLFSPGFYTIWIANRMLWAVTRGPEDESAPVPAVRRRSSSYRVPAPPVQDALPPPAPGVAR